MTYKTVIFLVLLGFVIGAVIGYSIHKPPVVVNSQQDKPSIPMVKDTIVKVVIDTIKIPSKQIRYFNKKSDNLVVKVEDTTTIKPTIQPIDVNSLHCVEFPLLLSDSSSIKVTECSTQPIPTDLIIDAKYTDKREKIRIVNNYCTDTVKINNKKRLGFTIGPSAGVGIDVNNIRQPVYFMGVTMTYGWRF